MGIGLLVGLTTAAVQSACYLLARNFLLRYGSPARLMVLSQAVFGGLALGGICWLLPAGMFGDWHVWPAWGCCAGGFLVGQFAFFSAQRRVESSRLASLYSVKIIVVALLAAWVIGERVTGGGMAAVALAVAAVFLINDPHCGGIDRRSMMFLAAAVLSFALSDIGGKVLVDRARTLGLDAFSAGLLTASLSSLLAAALLLPQMIRMKFRRAELVAALPYSGGWFLAVLGTFVCFGLLGATFGNVVQASRGVFSLVFGMLVVRCGATAGLERRLTRREWLRRSAGALLMFAAVALFAFSS